MKIQNTSDQPFSFEVTQIAPGEIKEVPDVIGQKLLALYWNKPLKLVEDKEQVMSKTETPTLVIEAVTSTPITPIEIKEEVKEEIKVKIPSMLMKKAEKVNENK